MQSRTFKFLAGVQTSTQPDPGTPSADYDIIPFGWLRDNYSPEKRIVGTLASPYVAVAGGGTALAHGLTAYEDEAMMFLEGPSVGTLQFTDTQIAAGTKVGQRLVIRQVHATKLVKFRQAFGISMPEIDDSLTTAQGTFLEFHWDGTVWVLSNWNRIGEIV